MKSLRKSVSIAGVSALSLILISAAPVKKSTPEKLSTAGNKAASEAVQLQPAQTVQPNEHTAPEFEIKLPEAPAATPAGPSAVYQIPWQSINGGGAPATSTNYQVNASVGQSAIGFATSTNYQHGAGYWYGAGVASCSCPFQADLDASTAIDAVDLALVIDIVFFGQPDTTDPSCPTSRADFDNSTAADAVDLALLIDHVFFGGPGPCDPCNPVQSTCA